MAEKHLKECTKLLVIREMQIKMALRFHLTPIIMAKIKTPGYCTCWRGCGERRTLLHHSRNYKLVQPLWKSIWRFLRKSEIDLPEDPAIPLLSTQKMVQQGQVFHYVHSGFICDSQKLETTQISHNRKMDTENVVHLHNGIVFSY